MARETRVEHVGACYHVLNRGSYKEWILVEEGAKKAFVERLPEAAVRSKWRVHAWVVMGNHQSLVIETPEAHLGAGIQRLQTTFPAGISPAPAGAGTFVAGATQGDRGAEGGL